MAARRSARTGTKTRLRPARTTPITAIVVAPLV
ncbi:MAG: hypothetical protein QOI52_914, partial [Chloroflexota bacterium]|nr:hypothetical protein [Chloroflexota bacterium]